MYRYTALGSIQRISDGAIIPLVAENIDGAELIEWLRLGNAPLPYEHPSPTDATVTREYQRRLLIELGATDLAHAAYIRADDTDEMISLLSKTRVGDDDNRLLELLGRRARIEKLIEKYNAMPTPIPSDFASDKWWQ